MDEGDAKEDDAEDADPNAAPRKIRPRYSGPDDVLVKGVQKLIAKTGKSYVRYTEIDKNRILASKSVLVWARSIDKTLRHAYAASEARSKCMGYPTAVAALSSRVQSTVS